ncbi:LnmK family bifunctional acyltransferase/decarboxylase [Paractinoplanes atraurantiacus]|uniref:Biosynthesis cluster domain-containing protein n=1 Tax=Paractinoplanes atraurantiacus TaxID=1036182 RepID=A0A285GM96_9ACTN|nr:LnmK family bifunctional acyltransferase/decarboxylase [Actinoplanes atraurantiacus]SNY24443.1 biosynthesis cluster domain-containing protein [Actinoplanes atraurantiacus]
MSATVLAARPGLRLVDGTPGQVARTELVTPGMCGPNALFFGAIGDWTWDAVSAACGTNVYDARVAGGAPTYLSFYYFHLLGTDRLHPLRVTFGDRLRVESGVFRLASESVLTLHRIRYDDGAPDRPVEAGEPFTEPVEGCLYAVNVNRWIVRGRPDSNRGLARGVPADFVTDDLPRLPADWPPRLAYTRARRAGVFDHDPPAGPGEPERFAADYPVEASRDLNGVGLLYFASYFSIVDWALLRLWRRLGRDDRSFARRVVTDQRICYLGNADADAVVRVELALRRSGPDEVVDVSLTDRASGDPLAIAALRMRPGGPL